MLALPFPSSPYVVVFFGKGLFVCMVFLVMMVEVCVSAHACAYKHVCFIVHESK